MTPHRILNELPAEFRVDARAGVWFAARRSVEHALAAAGYGVASDGRLAPSTLAGRRPLREIAGSSGPLLLRRFHHGGVLRFATGDRFLDPTRPFREILLSEHLRRAGVSTPEIVAARARRLALGGWQLDLVTRRVEGAIDLGWVLGMARRGEVRPERLRLLCVACGLLVGRLHAHGFLHADLTPNNVLVNRTALEDADPELVLLDLDRARIVAQPSDEERRLNLRRLYRFVERREARDGRVLARTDHARFLLGYDTGGAHWKDDWRAIARDHQRTRGVHRLGWWLEGLFGPGRDPRESPSDRRPRAGTRTS